MVMGKIIRLENNYLGENCNSCALPPPPHVYLLTYTSQKPKQAKQRYLSFK